jgi:hypothetical protein
MTTVPLQRAADEALPPALVVSAHHAPKPTPPRDFRLKPGWPLTALLALYPLWWILGLTYFIVIILALPMALHLWQRRPLRLPPGIMPWMVGVIWAAASGVMLQERPPDTLPLSQSAYVSFVVRLLNYLALTVIMLYVGNLTEKEMPRRRIVRMLSFFFLVTVAGGIAGMLFPRLSFRTPTLRLLDSFLHVPTFGVRLFTVSVAQVQDVLGSGPNARPSAPFEYTNTWGYALSLLLVWFVVGWWVYGRRRRRVAVPVVLAVAMLPVVYSLNRGLWVGLCLSVLFVVGKLALRGRVLPLVGLSLAMVVLVTAFVASPLEALVTERLAHGHSNGTRTNLNAAAVQAALHSPVLGYGGPRTGLGSDQSIAVGASAQCPLCGNRDIGSDGHLWFLLISQGFVGALAYVCWLLRVFWVYRRDRSPLGVAGQLSLLLPLFYMFIYPSLVFPLCLTVISVGLLWRNAQHRGGVRAVAG